MPRTKIYWLLPVLWLLQQGCLMFGRLFRWLWYPCQRHRKVMDKLCELTNDVRLMHAEIRTLRLTYSEVARLTKSLRDTNNSIAAAVAETESKPVTAGESK